MQQSREGWQGAAWCAAATGLGLCFAFWPTLASGFARMQADPGDTRFVNLVLEHGWRALTGRAALLDPPFFHPLSGVGAWSEIQLPLVPLYGLWRVLGFAPDTSLQLWSLTVAALNAVVGHFLLQRVVRVQAPAAAVGAFLIAFGSPRTAQLNHLHLLAVFFTLGVLWGLVRWLQPQTPRSGRWLLLAALCLGLQVWAGLYLAFFLLLALVAAAVAALAHAEGRALVLVAARRSWGAVAAAAVLAGALVLPAVRLFGGGVHHDFSSVKGYVPELHSWLNVGPEHWLYGWTASAPLFSRLASDSEHRLGIGVVTLGLVVWAFVAARKHLPMRVLGLVVLALVLVTLRWRWGVTPWWLVYRFVPGGEGLRAVARVGVFLLVPFGVAAAWGLSSLLERGRTRWAVALGLACVAEQARTPWSYDKAEARAHVASVVQALPAGCPAFVVDAAPSEAWRFEFIQLDAMWAALETGVPTVNGYSGRSPVGWPFQAEPVAQALPRWEAAQGLAAGSTCVLRLPR